MEEIFLQGPGPTISSTHFRLKYQSLRKLSQTLKKIVSVNISNLIPKWEGEEEGVPLYA